MRRLDAGRKAGAPDALDFGFDLWIDPAKPPLRPRQPLRSNLKAISDMSDPANCIPWKHYKPLFKQLVKRGIYTEAELDMQTQRHGELQLGYAVSFGDRIGALMFADDAETRRLIDTVATRKWRDTSAYRNIIRADAMAGDPALVEAVE